MQTLPPSHYHLVRPLLDGLMRFHASIAGVLTGVNPGAVYVDSADVPRVVLLVGPEGTYLAGDSPSAAQIAALKDQVADLLENGGIDALWLTCDPAWQPALDDFLPRSPLRIARQHYVCTAPVIDWRSRVPAGFAVHRLDEALFARADLPLPDHVHDWIAGNWGTRAHFLARGFGFVTEALETHTVVSWSLCDCIGDDVCEIGIRTHPAYRRRGLALLTSAAAVDYALPQGLRMVGWHCNADNTGSRQTALQAGFTLERDYESFATFRRESVHWAEAGRMQEVAGDYRAAAGYYLHAEACSDKPEWGPYIPFYAACAFARLGDLDSAWTCLHRAVAQGFDDADTLRSADVLNPLHATPAWDTLLKSLG